MLNSRFFSVINPNPCFFEICSLSTMHCWAILPIGCKSGNHYYQLYHRYPGTEFYHYQNRQHYDLQFLIEEILEHDDYKNKNRTQTLEEFWQEFGR